MTRRIDHKNAQRRRMAAPSGCNIHSTCQTSLLPEPQVGIEPTTARLRIECSTPELLWQSLPLPLSAPPLSSVVNALARTRTATPCGTTPSRWRVYQFHHQGPAPSSYVSCLSCVQLSVHQHQQTGKTTQFT